MQGECVYIRPCSLEQNIAVITELKHVKEQRAGCCLVSGYYIVCVFSLIQLYLAQCFVSGYYIVHMSSLGYSYM